MFARLQPGVSREQAHAALDPFFETVLERDLADRGFADGVAPTTRERYSGQPAVDCPTRRRADPACAER